MKIKELQEVMAFVSNASIYLGTAAEQLEHARCVFDKNQDRVDVVDVHKAIVGTILKLKEIQGRLVARHAVYDEVMSRIDEMEV